MNVLPLFPNAAPTIVRQLPPDAQPIRGQCIMQIFPDEKGWNVVEYDDNGCGWLGSGLPKEKAIAIGLDWVRRLNAELRLSNTGEVWESAESSDGGPAA